MSIFKKFKTFLTKHSGELVTAATVLETVVKALPIGRQDKENALEAIHNLNEAAESIAKSAREMKETADKVLTETDVRKIVRDEIAKVMKGAPVANKGS